ncbi:MAG: hypothetical protein QOF52_3036 [Propionibacteriaceae bacterium]|jgi:hypothetical protein|nr:hypothetical protein [Propionibacteriaceae bacterium]
MARAVKSRTPGTGRWWTRSRGLPAGVYDSYRASLAGGNARPPRILAWAYTPDGVCIGSEARLSYGDGTQWTHLGWHEIERGGWNSETSRLRWIQYGNRQGFVELTEPGRVPELFRERVAASILLEKFVPVRGRAGLTIVGRRDLGHPEAAIVWHTALGRGLSWDTEGVQEVADTALAQVRADYDIR